MQNRCKMRIKWCFFLKNFSALVLKFFWQKKQKTLNVGKIRKYDEEEKLSRNRRFPFFSSFFKKWEGAKYARGSLIPCMFSAILDLRQSFTAKFAWSSWCLTLPTTVGFTPWLLKLAQSKKCKMRKECRDWKKTKNSKQAKNADIAKNRKNAKSANRQRMKKFQNCQKRQRL